VKGVIPSARRAACIVALATLSACSSPGAKPEAESKPNRSAYPASWFAPLPHTVTPYSWEIVPDAAGPGEVILSKRTELGCFSNFAATPFELDGRKFASVEGFWQAMYYPEGPDDPRAKAGHWPHTREEVEAMASFEAKRAGDEAKKLLAEAEELWMSYGGRRFDSHGSADDQAYHLEIIERATRAKVAQNPPVRQLLLATGDLVLRPDHDQGKDATPAYRYFDILMRLRAELRAAPPPR
jgi:predicted NAD-dependent protein-ADP-ribosyltransferase YbiA (DUF1768 family)